jgi:hypothetical protein
MHNRRASLVGSAFFLLLSGCHSHVETSPTPKSNDQLSELNDVRLKTTYGRTREHWVLTGIYRNKTAYAVAFDKRSGKPVWIRTFRNATGIGDVQLQPNGHITVFLGGTRGFDVDTAGKYVEVLPSGEVVREWRAPRGYSTDNHELRFVVDSSTRVPRVVAAYLFGFDRRQISTEPHDSLVGHILFRVDTTGEAVPLFSGWDHFAARLPKGADSNTVEDIDHPNSIDFDEQGNLLVSWRNIDKITSLDAMTGTLRWQLGGTAGSFTFLNDPLGGFRRQHFVRYLPGGKLLLYDNGVAVERPLTRVAQYQLDIVRRTATLLWEWRPESPKFTPFVGSVQRLNDGSTFVGLALTGVAVELDAHGKRTWEGKLEERDSADGKLTEVRTYRLLDVPAFGPKE